MYIFTLMFFSSYKQVDFLVGLNDNRGYPRVGLKRKCLLPFFRKREFSQKMANFDGHSQNFVFAIFYAFSKTVQLVLFSFQRISSKYFHFREICTILDIFSLLFRVNIGFRENLTKFYVLQIFLLKRPVCISYLEQFCHFCKNLQ